MISLFLNYCHEDNIILFGVHNLFLDVPHLLTQGLLLENIGECIKTLPCIIQQNYDGHNIILNQIKYDRIGILLILLEVYSSFIGGRLLFQCGYITIKVII